MTNNLSLDVGDSFEIENEFGKHLHFLIAEESKENHSMVFLVYMSSKNSIYKDDTTILKPSEHPYITEIKNDSWFRYQNPIFCRRDEIAPLITYHFGKISVDLLHRIQQGFEKSDKVRKDYKKIYLDWKMDKMFDSL